MNTILKCLISFLNFVKHRKTSVCLSPYLGILLGFHAEHALF